MLVAFELVWILYGANELANTTLTVLE